MNKIKDLHIKLISTAVFGVYLVFRWLTNPQCLSLLLFKIPCPLCGMMRAFYSVLSLDFPSAFSYNPMFWSVPILFMLFLWEGKPFKNNRINIPLWVLLIIGFATDFVLKLY